MREVSVQVNILVSRRMADNMVNSQAVYLNGFIVTHTMAKLVQPVLWHTTAPVEDSSPRLHIMAFCLLCCLFKGIGRWRFSRCIFACLHLCCSWNLRFRLGSEAVSCYSWLVVPVEQFVPVYKTYITPTVPHYCTSEHCIVGCEWLMSFSPL